MFSDPASCGPETDLATAGVLLWENDCGVLPVTENSGKVIRMITQLKHTTPQLYAQRHTVQCRHGYLVASWRGCAGCDALLS